MLRLSAYSNCRPWYNPVLNSDLSDVDQFEQRYMHFRSRIDCLQTAFNHLVSETSSNGYCPSNL
jgi:hypothetical protein